MLQEAQTKVIKTSGANVRTLPRGKSCGCLFQHNTTTTSCTKEGTRSYLNRNSKSPSWDAGSKSTTGWGGNQLGSFGEIFTFFLFTLVCFLILHHPIFALLPTAMCCIKIPSLQLFIALPWTWNNYSFIFKWIFWHHVSIFLHFC